jgi:SAM-dependent methyltransferase
LRRRRADGRIDQSVAGAAAPVTEIDGEPDCRRETEVAEETSANAAQREYWNSVAGPRWVGLDGFVERRIGAVDDLILAHSGVKPGETVLEIGCGTGAFTVPLAAAVGGHGAVVGADISAAMLAGARQRLAESGLGKVSLIEADAQTHNFAPGRFDLVASRFGVMFFADPAAAFANLGTGLRRGGRLCFACWGTLAENRHWLIPYEVVLRRLGPPEPRPPRAPGPMAFADPDYVRSFLGAAGFADIAIDREHPGVLGSAPAEEAEFACLMGPAAQLIDEKHTDEATRRTLRREIEDAFAAYFGSGEATLPSTVLLVTAVRP